MRAAWGRRNSLTGPPMASADPWSCVGEGQGLFQGPHHSGDRADRLAGAAVPQEGFGHRQADRAGADRELPAVQAGGVGPQPGRGGLGDAAVPGRSPATSAPLSNRHRGSAGTRPRSSHQPGGAPPASGRPARHRPHRAPRRCPRGHCDPGTGTNNQPGDGVSRRRSRTGTRRSPYPGRHERQCRPTTDNAISKRISRDGCNQRSLRCATGDRERVSDPSADYA